MRGMRWLSRLSKRALGRDFTNRGERVDIVYDGHLDFEKLDVYQKSHFRRYQFACGTMGSGASVGDLACGTGYGTVMLATVAREAFGYDISPVVDVVRKRYAGIPNVTFARADILQIEAEARFDAIVSFETLEHFPPALVPAVLGKFNAMLKKGGKLVLSTPYDQEETAASRLHHRSFHITEKVLKDWITAAGFALDRLYYQNYDTHEIREDLAARDFMIALCGK
jgi:SAM-dependent methyltransferase